MTRLLMQQTAGRVNPVGNFSGFDDSIEYFFALAPTPEQSQGVAIYAADVVDFTSGCPDVAASVVYLRTGKVDPETAELDRSEPTTTLAQVRSTACAHRGPTLRNSSQIAFWKFDPDGAVLKYAAWIPNLQAWTSAATGVDFSNIIVGKAAPIALCPVIQDRCTGANQQYDNVVACVFELETKPFGSFDEAWGDNIACRTIHLILTKLRPDVHCPHVGPKGGSPPDNLKCVDVDYSTAYFDDAALFGAPLGSVFTCDGPLYS